MLFSAAATCRSVDTIACNAMISACEKSAKWQRALLLLSRMGFVGLQKTPITNSVASACQKAAVWQAALSQVDTAERFALCDDITFNSAIRACGGATILAAADKTGTTYQHVFAHARRLLACRVQNFARRL